MRLAQDLFSQPDQGMETDSQKPEIDLVRAAQGGDTEAFASLVRRYQDMVGKVAFALTGRVSLVEDVAQETFIVTWRRLREIREPHRFRSFVLGVTRRTSLRALRNQR